MNPVERASTTGHGWYDGRGREPGSAVRWPGGRPLALAFVVCAEHYELAPRPGADAPVNVPGMFGRGPYPDIASFSRREYGNRVGFFRLADMLSRHGLRATAAIDAGVARRCPAVVEEALRLEWAVAAHGMAVNDVISERMSSDEERDHIACCLETIAACTGSRPTGWHGAEYAESTRTPSLLARAGVRYLLDWPCGERPLTMLTPEGPILALPMSADFDDVHAMWHRRLAPERWCLGIEEAVDTLVREGEPGRVYVVNLHAWLVGQPFRAHALDGLLSRLTRRTDVWFTTTEEIACLCLGPSKAAASGSQE